MLPQRKLQLEASDEGLIPKPLQAWMPSHDVQFYENEQFLRSTVSKFLVEGVKLGQPIIVIATAAHRKAFAKAMCAAGMDPADLRDGRDSIWLDARETLSAFMEGGRPNAELFEATVGNVFEKVMKDRRYVMVRAYGEMVDVLWKHGKTEAALALEELWNALATKYRFSLLCAYAKTSLKGTTQVDGMEAICHRHSCVRPPEGKLRSA